MGQIIELNRKRKRSTTHTQLIKRAEQVFPGGSVGNVYNDTIIKRGAGSKVWDVSGNEYIDYLIGSGPMVCGHSHPKVVEAVRNQLDKGTTFFATHELSISLAEEVIKAVPCAERIRFCSSGTEATLWAMRAARAARGRDKILKFEGGFHGMNDYALMSVFPTGTTEWPLAEPNSGGIPNSIAKDVLVAPFNDVERTVSIIEAHHDELGGVIIEPFQRLLKPIPGFLESLREVTKQYNIPLIFDEVVTGFRLSYGGAQDYYGITPDLSAVGKILGGGFPLAAVVGKQEFMYSFDPKAKKSNGYMPQYGTLNGNPIAVTAGLATLEILNSEGFYERLFQSGRRLMDGLKSAFENTNIPLVIFMFLVVESKAPMANGRRQKTYEGKT